jgi:hypothetical protein
MQENQTRRRKCDVARPLLVLVTCVLLLTDCSCFVLRQYKNCINVSSSRKLHDITVRSTTQNKHTTTCPPIWFSHHRPRLPLRMPVYSTNASHLDPNKQSSTSSAPSLGKRIVNLYVGYCKRLWRETSPLARKNFTKKNTIAAIGRVQKLVKDSCDGALGQENREDQELLKAKKMMYVRIYL